MVTLFEKLAESSDFVKRAVSFEFENAIYMILGSGFKNILADLEIYHRLPMSSIPHIKPPLVDGHGSDLIFTALHDIPLIIQTGRIHLYEGYSVEDVVYTVRLASRLGIKRLICTNASGSLRHNILPGTIHLIADQINLTGHNALTGESGILGPRFVDMLECFDTKWISQAQKQLGLTTAVYIGLLGPTYETAAETRMLGLLGGDLVGMSTVQEVIAAKQLGLRTLGISLATNFAAGLSDKVNHKEVLDIGNQAAPTIRRILPELVKIVSNY